MLIAIRKNQKSGVSASYVVGLKPRSSGGITIEASALDHSVTDSSLTISSSN